MLTRQLPLLHRQLRPALHAFALPLAITRHHGRTTAFAPALTVTHRRCSTANTTSTPTTAAAPPPPSPSQHGRSSDGKGNYFAFFSLSPHPVVDVTALQKLYHNLQRRVHPDQQQVQQRAAKSASPCVPAESAHTASVDISTYANAAYEALRSPYSRCRYLSRWVKAQEVKGSPLTPAEEEELLVDDDRRTMKARDASPDAPMDEDFLMEMLMMNELIFAGDAEEEAVRRQWAALRADLEDRAVGYFKDAVTSWDAGEMAKFHRTVLEWTYVNNALNNLKERML